jgi:glycosyltransferase involved in cell wall biosynthesis
VKYLSAFFLLFLSWQTAWGMPVVDVKDRHTHLDLGQRLEYLETKEEAVWPWEVSSQPGWQVAHTDYPSFGLDTSSHWFRFGLRNISGEIQLVMLGVEKGKEAPEYCEFHWNPDQSKIKEIYSSCDIFLFPSRREAFANTPLEAMACQCALVGTTAGGVPDYAAAEE